MKQTKGLYLQLILSDGSEHFVNNISTISEAIYIVKRRFLKTPGMEKVFLFVGTRNIGHILLKDGTIMTATQAFAQFEQENAGEFKEFLPFAKGADKEMLVAFALPFQITNVTVRKSTFPDENGEFGNEYLYDLVLDPTDPTYIAMQKIKDIKPAYCCSFAENPFRKLQLDKMIMPAIQAESPMKAILVKRGRAYAFGDPK